MPEQSAPRIDCAHCGQTGRCKSGKDDSSCAVCIKRARLSAPPSRLWLWWHPEKPDQSAVKATSTPVATTGLVCSVCGGVGRAEPKTLRFLNLFLPWFASCFVALLLILLLVLALKSSDHFQAFLTFAGTAIGSVTGYRRPFPRRSVIQANICARILPRPRPFAGLSVYAMSQ
jgi:hypothetical protein